MKPGDRVLTSGLGGIFPAGIRIGIVERVGLEPNGLTKEIVVEPAVDFRGLEEVLVYVPGSSGASAPSDIYPPDARDSTATDSSSAAAPVDSLRRAR